MQYEVQSIWWNEETQKYAGITQKQRNRACINCRIELGNNVLDDEIASSANNRKTMQLAGSLRAGDFCLFWNIICAAHIKVIIKFLFHREHNAS